MSTVICLMGPTASGKTALALALYKKLPIEIISVDATQVYQGLDIGSGKPSAAVLAQVPHRLINICEPNTPYSAAQFCEDALQAIKEIHTCGRIPLLVGGTMLYFQALLNGLSQLPAADPKIRAQLNAQAYAHGWPALHRQLAKIDPVSAARLRPNDSQRVQRALEIYQITQRPMSTLFEEQQAEPFPYEVLCIGLMPREDERHKLHHNIITRFQTMLEQGFIAEVKQLIGEVESNQALPALRAVGYRQIIEYLAGTTTYSIMQEKAVAATRQLAKRQLTWLRSWPGLQRLNCFDPNLLETASQLCYQACLSEAPLG